MMMIEDEFRLLAGLVAPFDELDLRQPEQVRLLQALKKLRRRSNKIHRALVSLSPHPADSMHRSTIIQNRIRWRLRTKQLPVLHDQLHRLSLLLDPSCLPERPNGRFREALGILLEMDDSIELIKTSADSVWYDEQALIATPDANPPPGSEHLEHLTVHRCLLVVSNCKSVLIELSRAIESYERFFRVLVLTDGRVCEADQPADYLQEFRKESIPRTVAEQLQRLETFIHWLLLSNLAILESDWRAMIVAIDETLTNLLEFGKAPSIRHDPEKPNLPRQIEALIPVVKLSRLFLNKLSSPTNSLPRLTSGMSLELIDSLRLATSPIPFDLSDILNTFDTPRPHHIALTTAIQSLVGSARKLNSIFNNHFDSLQLDPHLNPLGNGPIWFKLWITEFDLAMVTFIRISQNTVDDDAANQAESVF
ncbi:hypothetical protein PTTG_01589 [Puccinia triticina 1-1 BBBD Race 1]|uniref:Uncharacterized protein n=2 Tax=Puccinia triticina TaxID=208348 RepID=A0A180GKV7_PUCT1|nr:uncharacterized protein PtA15_6A192 [Puccinia triticina]OAV93426.1 hypothetical protein PTTG_01589 [Puccinia triticina 1-1 BBBD Race 1]WAQ85564.1 hypothetical protein PtA15_6A192 [Puccinia triticina]WAR55446.1 hypothetical protein PtB15_6B187 [Puccinia triticina]